MKASFNVGQLVRLRAGQSKSGPVIELLSLVGGVQRYRVLHGPSDVRDYYADQLESAETSPAPDALFLIGIAAYLGHNGTLEHARQIAAHESPRATKLYDRTSDQITLDEIERIAI